MELKTFNCWHCGKEIPLDSKHCPYCGLIISVKCPKCGYLYLSKYPRCPECGTHYDEYIKELEQQKETESESLATRKNDFDSNLNSMGLIIVNGGSFLMGATNEQGGLLSSSDRKPAHPVTLNSFAIAKYQVTQELWLKVMGYNNSHFIGSELPVENITLFEIEQFIIKLRNITKMPLRLPTEAEWEFAARGGNLSRNYTCPGGNNAFDLGWIKENSNAHTHPVGQKMPNELGLYDMLGNVYEFCADLYDPHFYRKSPRCNPVNLGDGNTSGTWIVKNNIYVLRGSHFASHVKYTLSSFRSYIFSDGKNSVTGFRLASDYPF